MSLAGVAKETLAIVAAGRYRAPSGATRELGPELAAARAGTRLYEPEELAALVADLPAEARAWTEGEGVDLVVDAAQGFVEIDESFIHHVCGDPERSRVSRGGRLMSGRGIGICRPVSTADYVWGFRTPEPCCN